MTLPSVEVQTAPNPAHAVIWLHGLGADGNDFAPIVLEFVDPKWPALRFVFPHAPVRRITINNGAPMRAWYDIAGMEISQRQDEPGVRASILALNALIAREVARGILAENIFVAGFSQGGAIALAGGVRHALKLGGIIGLSTYLPIAETTAGEIHASNAATPIFLAHGTHDPIVAHALGLRSLEYLRALNMDVTWREYPMAHQVCAQEISDLRAWLGERLR